jgi:hypothetical protein
MSDPNFNRPVKRPIDRDETSYTPWVIGALVALAVIIGVFAMTNRTDKTSTAANNPTAPASTTTIPPSRPTTAPATTGAAAPSTPAPAPAAQ